MAFFPKSNFALIFLSETNNNAEKSWDKLSICCHFAVEIGTAQAAV
jgi:hypothetical protein